jgi:AhpC/TSA family protein
VATKSPVQLAPAGWCWRSHKLFDVLQVGEKAPDFKLPTTGGQELTLEEALQKHRALVFLFYVLDFTGG